MRTARILISSERTSKCVSRCHAECHGASVETSTAGAHREQGGHGRLMSREMLGPDLSHHMAHSRDYC